MPTTTRTIRVFISSTFSDLKTERNALQQRVFPCLKRYCQRRGWSFQAIDLRWGISNEAALDQSTMRICRAEIARCQAVTPRPNFVVLLGDRHGWRPLPDEIPATEFEALRPRLPAELANRWYRLDENAVCPLPNSTDLDKGRYILQPRTGEFKDYDKWFDEVERPLGDAFRRAAREEGLPEDARLKYEASATAQEIQDGAFAVPDAREHVVAFIREIRTADGRSLREATPGDAAVKEFVDLKQGELDHESQDQLDALKQKLRAKLGDERVKTYPARWEGSGASIEHVQRLSLDVLRSLGRLIHAQIKQHSALPPLKEEQLRHQEFAQRRARDFTGQAGPLGEIERYLAPTSEPTTPLIVHGASGSGKSALLAKAVQEGQKEEVRIQKGEVIARFIGATANSTDPRSLLEGLCRELGELYGADNADLPLDLNKLLVIFRPRLELATAEHPLTLFLDALDQLQVSDRPELSWLPDKLPPHVRLVVSSIAGPTLDRLKSHLPSARFLELGPMRAEDAGELLQKWLQRASRRLAPEEQRQAIRLGFIRCSLPLYLRLAFEEAQRWRSYDTPPPPSPDVDGLIERLFSRLSEPANHGPLLVERAVSYLRCSRHGLSEDETLDLLTNDPEYWEQFQQSAQHALPVTDGQQTRRLPVVLWSRLYHDLEPYLSWRSADGTVLMVFFHTRFNEIADRRFLFDDTVRRARHDRLATYFRNLADPENNQTWKGGSPRPFLQVAFHLAGAQRLDELYVLLLGSPGWMNAQYAVSASCVSYMDDLMLAMQTNPNLLTLVEIRAAKEAAPSRVRHYHNDDLQILVRLGREEEALAVARSRSGPEEQCDSLIALFEAKMEKQADLGLLESALASASRIQHDYRRATMLGKIASHVAETGAIERACEIADLIGSALCRSRALKAVAVAMTRAGDTRASLTFMHALEATRQIADPSEGAANQASAMTEIAEELIRLKDDQATRVLEDAFQIADRIATPWKRFAVHKDIAAAWAHQGASDRVFQVALRIKDYQGNDEGRQPYWLAQIAQLLLELQMFDLVLQVIGWIGDTPAPPESRSSALLAIASAFAQAGNEHQAAATFDQALNVAHQIPDDLRRVRALVSAGLALHQAGYGRAASALAEALAIADGLENSEGDSEMGEIAKALAEIGDSENAIARAHCVQDNYYRSEAFQEIAKTLVKTGGLSQALQLVQTHDGALASIATSLVSEGKFDTALVVIDQIKRPRLQARPLAQIGVALSNIQDGRSTSMFTRALDALNRDEKANGQAYELKEMAKLLLDGGDERASNVFDQSRRLAVRIEDEPELSAALKQIVVALAQLGQFDRALEISRKLLRGWTQAEALKEIAISLAQAQDFEDALSVAMEIRDGRNGDALVSNSASRAEALCAVALGLENSGHTKTALEVLERAILAATDIPSVWSWQQAFILEGIATQFAHVFQVDRALAAANQIQHESRVTRALAAVAIELANTGDTRRSQFLDQALKRAERISEPGERAEALKDVALVLAKAKNGQASQLFRRAVDSALKANSKNGQSYPMQLIGEALAQSGNFEWAVEVANHLERGWRRTPVLQALFKSLVLAGDQRAPSLFEELLEEARLVGTYNGARDGVLKSIIVDLVELDQRQRALRVVAEMSVDSASGYRIEARNLIAKSFAQSGKFDEALSTLELSSVSELHDRVSVLIFHLASWAPAFEKFQSGLSLEILSEITRIGGWTCPAWLRIYDILTRTTSQCRKLQPVPSGLANRDPLAQPLREITVAERRESAARCFQKGLWEAAAGELQKLLASGEPLVEHGPKLVTCLLNAHETPLASDIKRIETILQQLEQAGHATLTAPLRLQLQSKLPRSCKKWWKIW